MGTQFKSKVPVSAWAAASCSWSRGVCVNGGSGPRPAVMYSVLHSTPVNAAKAIRLRHWGDLAWVGHLQAPKARPA